MMDQFLWEVSRCLYPFILLYCFAGMAVAFFGAVSPKTLFKLMDRLDGKVVKS
jgi:hypothetical protein